MWSKDKTPASVVLPRAVVVPHSTIDDPSISVDQNKVSKETIPVDNSKKITSPIIGTAYLAPEPGGKKFIEVGKKIKKGDTVMIVEAMKTMNHVPSHTDGIVKEITVEDGQPVEFGQTIAILI